MTTFTKQILSGSTDGRGIGITTSGSPGDTIHTSTSGSSNFDEIWIYSINQLPVSADVTIEFGGTNPTDDITVIMPSKVGMQLVVPGMLLNNGTIVSAYSSTGSGIIIQGFVNRITYP